MTAMEQFDGRKEAKFLEKKIGERVKNTGKIKQLLIVLVGNDEVSKKYIALKTSLCNKFGIPRRVEHLSTELPDDKIELKCSELFHSNEFGSVIVQLPLPRESLDVLLDEIPVEKDIDLLSTKKRSKYFENEISFKPPVVRACEYFIDSIRIDMDGKKSTVVGGGYLVGKPMSVYLENLGSAVEVIETYKRGKQIEGDLVILSAGIPNLVDGGDISQGAHVVDFGSSFIRGEVKGDLDMSTTLDHLGVISPSPGGMGPLVVRFLIMNHLGI